MPDSTRILVGRPVGYGFEHADVGSYLGKLSQRASLDNSVTFEQCVVRSNDIAEMRNAICLQALAGNYDYLLMIDPDIDATQGSFLSSSLTYLKSLDHLAVVGAPYCGAPDGRVQVGWPREGRFGRDAATTMGGIGKVSWIGTGLLLIPLPVLHAIATRPWFARRHLDANASIVSETADVYFCRKCRESNVTVYCNWDHWAGHWQWMRLGKPGKDSLR